MSATAVNDVITRAMTDEAFRAAVEADVDTATAEFDLSAGELETLRSRDEEAILTAAGRQADAAYVQVILSVRL